MRARFVRILQRGALLLAVSALTLLAIRAYDSQRGPPLAPWHTYVPPDPRAEDIDGLDWAGYLQAEDATLDAVRTHVTNALDAKDRVPFNRYFDAGPIYPPRLSRDWNRSFVLEPDGAPAGAVVLLHGLTDSPYSTRHIARRYAARGWIAVAIRLPAHGTVPGALTDVEWEDWQAATRLALREARRRVNGARQSHRLASVLQRQIVRLGRADRLVHLPPFLTFQSIIDFTVSTRAIVAALYVHLPPNGSWSCST